MVRAYQNSFGPFHFGNLVRDSLARKEGGEEGRGRGSKEGRKEGRERRKRGKRTQKRRLYTMT